MSRVDAPKALTFTLLRLLADGEFHSGEVLAQRLDISRASVNKALRDVAELGLDLYSIRGRGYRLSAPLQWLDAARITKLMGKAAQQFHIEISDSGASSNTLLLQRAELGEARGGPPSGAVLALEWQSAGRGRMGRTWHSALGGALTFSVLWRFERGLSALSGLSLAVGVGLTRALHKLGAQDVHLKWPNDVLDAQGAKLAGILIEARGDMLGPCTVVMGIGLNLSLSTSMRRQIEQPVTSLAEILGNSNFNSKAKQGGEERTRKTVQVARRGVSDADNSASASADSGLRTFSEANTVSPMKWNWNEVPERNQVLAVILCELHGVLCEFAAYGFAALRAEWERSHGWQNMPVMLLLPDGVKVRGVARGVDDTGALRVETAQGVKHFNAGEISLRKGV